MLSSSRQAMELTGRGLTGSTHLSPRPSGRRGSFFVSTPLASAATRFVVSAAAMFAGSSGWPVLVVNDLCVPLPAEIAIAGT